MSEELFYRFCLGCGADLSAQEALSRKKPDHEHAPFAVVKKVVLASFIVVLIATVAVFLLAGIF